MDQDNFNDDWKQRMYELEEKNMYYKLKRREKKELKALHKKKANISLEEKKRKEEERLNEMKKKVLENQKRLREMQNDNDNMTDIQKNKQINDVLEDMCIYGAVTKKEIKEEKIKHPERFIETSQALNMETKDEGIFALGLISQNLENLGIETAIECSQDSDTTSLQFLTNGMIDKKSMICISNLKKKEMKNY